ncbi:hypothetical protein OVA03_14645 [Asticcacaulis sp. SL142]|uniref:DUF3885 domain-containing protein n=1 Tax=Asticcacaulis sp. SL142 TaxID=2995155 RepID=UPI00226CE442|nr:hypothetical protein [Asticcacaulis sp. SL142]WAC47925.1 hypothetical protein OVA03_14645 [Asticcacaulis sp. SL142]
MKTFHDAWQKFHPDSLPMGHLVRESENDNWLRFHSLPESKRYADTEAEMAIILERQNIIASEVLGSRACWIASSLHILEDDAKDDEHWVPETRRRNHNNLCEKYQMSHSFYFRDPDPDVEIDNDLFTALTAWQAREFDEVLRDIAGDMLTDTLWMSADTGAIFAPYDGGVDLILPDVSEIARLRTKYSDWLSSHPSGY